MDEDGKDYEVDALVRFEDIATMLDKEKMHKAADEAIAEFLEAMDFPEIAEIYQSIIDRSWYS